MFPDGADKYIDDIGKLVNLRDGTVRTAVDTGCGVRALSVFLRFLFFDFWFVVSWLRKRFFKKEKKIKVVF